jgi:uncharacterized protein YjbK
MFNSQLSIKKYSELKTDNNQLNFKPQTTNFKLRKLCSILKFRKTEPQS